MTYRNINSQESQIEILKQKGAHIEKFESLTICTYISTIRGNEYPAMCVFRGKSKKPILCGYFSQGWSVFSDRLLELKEDELDRIERESEYKREKKERYEKACKGIKEGDIFYNSWGYEQTNIDFYLVTGRPSKCFVELTPIGSKSIKITGPDSDKVVANPSSKIGEPMRCKIDSWGNVSVGRYNFQSASKWDGSALHRSWGY